MTLNWNPPLQGIANVAGYNIHWWPTSGSEADATEVPAYMNYTVTIPNFCAGSYNFVARSYNSSGTESSDSNQVNVGITNQTGANEVRMQLKIPEAMSLPIMATPEKFCDMRDPMTGEITRQIDPSYKAVQAMMNGNGVHSTIRILKVQLDLGVPSDKPLETIAETCDGERCCQLNLSDVPDPSPNTEWSMQIDWMCDHNPNRETQSMTVSKHAVTIPINCDANCF